MDQIDESAERWFSVGVGRMNASPVADLPGAVAAFTRALFLAPNAPALHAHRAEALLRLCDFHAALMALRRAHALEPSDQGIRARLAQLHYLQGRLHMDAGETEQAAESFSAALALQPRYSDCWLLRIKAWIRGRSYGRALHELNTFITHPDSEGYFRQQEVSHSAGQQQQQHEKAADESKEDEGAAAFDALSAPPVSAPPPAPEHALPSNLDSAAVPPAILDTNSSAAKATASELSIWRTVQALLLRAKLHILLDRSDLALRDAHWSHSLSPNSPEVLQLLSSLSANAAALYGEALGLVLAAQPAAAIQKLTRALELDAREVKCYALRASLLRGEKRYDESLADLKVALQLTVSMRMARKARDAAARGEHPAAAHSEPTEQLAGGQTFLSEVADDQARAAAAVEPMDEEKDPEQIALEKSLALTFNGLGVQYFQQGEFSHGVSCLSKAIELTPSTGGAGNKSLASFFANRADCFWSLGQADAALSDYHLSLRSDPGNYGARSKIGSIHARRGRELFNAVLYEAAEAEYTRAIGIDPFCSLHFFERAKTFYALHRYEQSYRDVEEAVRLKPSDQAARNFLLQLRQALLRPEDVARAPALPALPKPDKPFSASAALRAQQRVEAGAARDRRARSAAAGGSGGASRSSAYVPGVTSANAARQGRRNGQAVMQMVFGER